MLNIKKILQDNGVTEGLDGLEDAITKEIGKDFVPKTQYAKKVQALEEATAKISDMEATDKSGELEKIKGEFEAYKQNIEAEKVRGGKIDKLTAQLKGEGFNEKIVKLLTKQLDVDSIEIENESIKGWDELVKPLKTEYADFISVQKEEGAGSANPPGKEGNNSEPLDLRDALRQQYKM